ncbi:hypothetical protein RMN57_00935 [Kitasatospora sp. CM 4170]|uniref:Uncharacterized protein n=1 Tax=Kitasatospora aburaviensis TaxID=67265 RepID=A0ABW1F668_9ACTN|nr:hypothetical protein [Kitasatospora sp. CM 4170]WNM43369.1 hypothetical protein RMN57_00935 [Kitasatospora sp. CM 4170]
MGHQRQQGVQDAQRSAAQQPSHAAQSAAARLASEVSMPTVTGRSSVVVSSMAAP